MKQTITMKKILYLLIFISLFSCHHKNDKKIMENLDASSLKINSEEQKTDSNKLEIDGIYFPAKRFNIEKFELESFYITYTDKKFSIEINFIDTVTRNSYVKNIFNPTLKGDSLFFGFEDKSLGEFQLKSHFLMSPLDNPKVKPKSTIVLKGEIRHNSNNSNAEFTYFAGD
jgi:hypothetical protein